MRFLYDPMKNEKNIRERELSFDDVADFNFITAVFRIDNRRDYGEIRYRSFGFLRGRLYVLVFVNVPDGIRIISFRKANKREVKFYEKETQS